MPSSVTYIQCDARFLHPFPPHSHPPNTTQQQIQPIPNELTNPTPPPNPPHFTLQHQKTQQLVRARSGGSGFSSGNESDDGNASGGSLGGDGSGGLGGYKIPAGVWRVGVFARFLKFENVRQHFPGAFLGVVCLFWWGVGVGVGWVPPRVHTYMRMCMCKCLHGAVPFCLVYHPFFLFLHTPSPSHQPFHQRCWTASPSRAGWCPRRASGAPSTPCTCWCSGET